jgi:hypothetical protein
MKTLLKIASLSACLFAAPAFALDTTCEMQAGEKKLAGAAKNSFVKKCEKTAQTQTKGAACESQAAEKKIYGAAKNSFVKKCKADAMG